MAFGREIWAAGVTNFNWNSMALDREAIVIHSVRPTQNVLGFPQRRFEFNHDLSGPCFEWSRQSLVVSLSAVPVLKPPQQKIPFRFESIFATTSLIILDHLCAALSFKGIKHSHAQNLQRSTCNWNRNPHLPPSKKKGWKIGHRGSRNRSPGAGCLKVLLIDTVGDILADNVAVWEQILTLW